MKRRVYISLFIIIILSGFGCKKDKGAEICNCYEETLVHENLCPADCPGFEGCNGETYCNECEAAKLGVGPK